MEQEYWTARICREGHILTAAVELTSYAKKFCTEFGCQATGIDKCESCGAPIRGLPKGGKGAFKRPRACDKCGKPFPWTESL